MAFAALTYTALNPTRAGEGEFLQFSLIPAKAGVNARLSCFPDSP